jgi:ketosteroid isomerase-like protein
MSQENVELTKRLNSAFNRRDVEAAVALWDPDCVWSPAEVILERPTYRGHAGVRQYYEDLAEFAEGAHAELAELRDLGDQVLGLGRISMRFAGGIELEEELGGLYKWRGGKCLEARVWLSHADAIEAAGLRE